jgi:hypothetical protein
MSLKDIMKDLLSIKLDLIRFELLTIEQLRGNPGNCLTKNFAISERILELEKSIEEIRGALQ